MLLASLTLLALVGSVVGIAGSASAYEVSTQTKCGDGNVQVDCGLADGGTCALYVTASGVGPCLVTVG